MMIPLFVVISFISIKCDKDNKDDTTFNFTIVENIDSQIYDEIKKTCGSCWKLENMIDSTFYIISDTDEFSIHCDGILDGQLYHFVIRTDSTGKWINDGRIIVQTSDEFLDITYLLSYFNKDLKRYHSPTENGTSSFLFSYESGHQKFPQWRQLAH